MIRVKILTILSFVSSVKHKY